MKRASYVFSVVFSVVFLDQIMKYLIINYVSPFDSIDIFPFLHIVSVRNTGAAFGSFKGFGSGGFIAISVIAIIFVINLLRKRMYNTFALSLVLGGAIGNLIDRVLYGKVVDFVDLNVGRFHWPAFNVADSALTVGIVVILITSISPKK
jgi:signal peptidase II